MRKGIYILVLACILLISCSEKSGSPIGPTDLAERSQPIISYFTATPSTIKLGEKSTLSWNVDNCTKVEIDGGIGLVSPTGSIGVSPLETTTYTLTATNTSAYEPLYSTFGVIGSSSDSKTTTITVEK